MLTPFVLVVLPLFVLALAWALGRAVAGLLQRDAPSEPAAVFVGAAAMLAVLSNLSFLGVAGTRPGTPVVLVLAALAIACGWRHLRAPRWRELAVFALVPVVAYLHFLWPLLQRPGAETVLMFAGDYNQYVAVAAWLQDHPFTVPAALDAGFNTLQVNVLDHQRSSLRIGAQLLLGFFATLGGVDVPAVYSVYCGFILGLQALAVALLARHLAPALPLWAAALAGLLYGVTPTAAWAAYAAFVPQTLGLAFLVAGVVAAAQLVAPEGERPRLLRRALAAGLVWFAAWSTYPEAVPLGALVVLAFVVVAHGARLAQAGVLRMLAIAAAGVLAAWVLASPLNFRHGVQGLLVQVQATAHGGAQNVSPWTLFATAIGAMQQPLIGDIGRFQGRWFEVASLAACALGLAGIVTLSAGRRRALPLAIAFAGALLVWYIQHRYAYERNAGYAGWDAMLTWNLYKAAAFLAPFLTAMAIAGVLVLGQRLGRAKGLGLAAALVATALVPAAVHQARWSHPEMSFLGVPPEARRMFATIPPGRLLLDVHNGEPAQERYRRYGVYSVLAPRAFLSTRDGQPTQLYALFDDDTRALRAALLSEPFSFVLSDRPLDHARFPQLARAGGYTLLDARGQDFQVTLQDYGAPPVTLVNFARAANDRAVAVTVMGLPADTRVLYHAFGDTQAVPARTAGDLTVRLTVPAAGGLARFVFEPTPSVLPAIVVEDGLAPQHIPARIDLVALMSEEEVAGDAQGARLVMHRQGAGVRLDMPTLGTSRVRVAADLYPGEYTLVADIGDVRVDQRSPDGFAAFLGEENVKEGTLELQARAHTQQKLRIVVRQQRKALFLVGFGAWGQARGSLELRSLVLVRRTDRS